MKLADGRWSLYLDYFGVPGAGQGYVPFLADAFRLVPLTAMEYFEAMLLAFMIIPIVEIVKAFQRMYYKKKGQ